MCRVLGRASPFLQRLVVCGMDSETAVQLRPRQTRLLLESLEALREVLGEVVGPSAVVCALSRHGAPAPPVGRIRTPSTESFRADRNPRMGKAMSGSSPHPSAPADRESPFRAG